MPVRELSVAELGAFEKANLSFVDGLNVFIGANGTGKTHVLKLLYVLLESARGARLGSFRDALAMKLAGVFRPDEAQIGRLVRRRQGLNTATAVLTGGDKERLTFKLHTKGNLTATARNWGAYEPAIFLPTREVLAMYEGFIHAYRERELSFDETYLDACIALNANPLRGSRGVVAETLVRKLQGALGGHVELQGNRFYVKFRGDRARMEAHLVAEGLRKIASLERLVRNGSLTKNGYLFWDEPEANLNPKLVVAVADILGELARSGVQTFLTTHDYLLARRLSLSAKLPDWPPMRFFAFYRERPGAPVEVTHADSFAELPTNPLVEEFSRLYDFEMELLREDPS